MNIYKELPELEESIITIGSFDGLHLGHQYLIHEVKKIAAEQISGAKAHIVPLAFPTSGSYDGTQHIPTSLHFS